MQQPRLSRVLYFGLQFDDQIFTPSLLNTGGVSYLGPAGMIRLLENYLGLSAGLKPIEHLRIEEYRQALDRFLAENPTVFYKGAFEADPFSTTIRLLEMRDELAGSGRDFGQSEEAPERIEVLGKIEGLIRAQSSFPYLLRGKADRLNRIMDRLPQSRHPIEKVCLFEPYEWLPPVWQRLFSKMQACGLPVLPVSSRPSAAPESDLGLFQEALSSGSPPGEKQLFRADGSLLVLQCRRDTDAATFLARLSRENPDFRPAFLIPEKKRTLDNALFVERMPSMGVLSSSSARPSLQLLKLAPIFLWDPVDPVRILEFASLPIQPLHADLTRQIARSISRRPGLNNPDWEETIRRFFGKAKAESEAQNEGSAYRAMRKEFAFWFKRKRYPAGSPVPAREVIDLYRHLANWAGKAARENELAGNTLAALNDQCQQIVELIETFPDPETPLFQLDIERIVRTIYEPSPLLYQAPQCGHFNFFHHPGGCPEKMSHLVWWSFIRKDPDHFFSPWYLEERDFLSRNNCQLAEADNLNRLQLWYYKQPILQAEQKVLLIIPDFADGKEAYPHTLHDFLQAWFRNAEAITFRIDPGMENPDLPGFGKKVHPVEIPLGIPPRIQASLQLRRRSYLGQIPQASPTDLARLFYYPHQWFFKKKTRFIPSPLFSTPPEHTLLGNLAHRFFEILLSGNFQEWNKEKLEKWSVPALEELLLREGASLLLYGKEPDRANFINQLQNSAWIFISLIRNNGWRVAGTEVPLSRPFFDLPVRGKADLVLEREGEQVIVDFKWRGSTKRENQMRNEEDLQLVLYAHLLGYEEEKTHTAFYIIKDARMIARNQEAFEESRITSPEDPVEEIHRRIVQKMKKTLDWRLEQLSQGFVELRNTKNAPILDEQYGEILLSLLEMKDEDDLYDEYKGLLL